MTAHLSCVRIVSMKRLNRLMLGLMFFLIACQPQSTNNAVVYILDGSQLHTITTSERTPTKLLDIAAIQLNPEDQLLFQGSVISPENPLPNTAHPTLQIRRTVTLTVNGPDGERQIQTTAFTVGAALQAAGFALSSGDFLDPPASTPINGQMTITYRPAKPITIEVDGNKVQNVTAALTVGQALAEAGIALEGLDYSLPAESEPSPADGQIKVIRVQESVLLVQKPIPFNAEFQASADVELDKTELLQAGEYGLSVSRVRVRYEDGREISRQTESETVVRPPKDRVMGYGTKVVVRTTTVDGVKIEYWRAVNLYATSYSPCRSGADRCYTGTASGLPVKKGVVAVIRSWFNMMSGQQVYIPGYGSAVIADIGGGISGKPWIDLGWSDDDYQPMTGWVTVYFLTPVPPSILYNLQ
jgi:uncharacterized protein YabE (DUF348 family)